SRRGEVPRRQPANGVSLGRAKADSPSPRDGPQHSIPEIGFGALPRAIQTGGGKWQDLENTTEVFFERRNRNSGGWIIAIARASARGNQPIPMTGRRLRSAFARGCNPATVIRC